MPNDFFIPKPSGRFTLDEYKEMLRRAGFSPQVIEAIVKKLKGTHVFRSDR
ncbi:MAG: hypothetical protein ACUVXI_09700 [bacterium]